MRAVLLSIGFLAFLLGNVAEACSVGPAPPSPKIGPGVVVFAGVVEGYVDEGYALPIDFLKGKPTAAGLKVRVTEGVVRAQAGTLMDVYPMGHGPDCKSRPYGIDTVQERYRVGTTVAVVAFSEPGEVGIPTTVRSFEIGNHGITDSGPADDPHTANGTINFAQVSKFLHSGVESTEDWHRRYAARAFQYYETYKSLALLESATDEPSKVMELENIRYYYGYQCMMVRYARNLFVDLVHNTRLSESAQTRVLAELPAVLPKDFYPEGYKGALKGTVFEGYCEDN